MDGFAFSIIAGIRNLAGLKDFFAWKEETKIINDAYLDLAKQKGIVITALQMRWTSKDKLSLKLLEGWEIVYEADKENKKKYRLENNSGQTLTAIYESGNK